MLGPPIRVEPHRKMAIFLCPFCSHPDPNLGVNLERGNWKCLRCDAAGPNLETLDRKLHLSSSSPAGGDPKLPPVSRLEAALAEARVALPQSPAAEYLSSLGIQMPVVLAYGLGYGQASPAVDRATQEAAYYARLMTDHGFWLWSGSLVYADPPTQPALIQVRHLRRQAETIYQTWGRMASPLGAWRLRRNVQKVVVVKDLAAMLVVAQALHERGVTGILPVCTGGISATYGMLQWFGSNLYEYVLLAEPGERDWVRPIVGAIRRCPGSQVGGAWTPDGLAPVEAFRQGWWPDVFPTVSGIPLPGAVLFSPKEGGVY